MLLFLPFIGLTAAIGLFLTGCDERKSDTSSDASPPSTPCPAGWSHLELESPKNQTIHLCHQDPSQKSDGVYQKESDQLGLRIGDRFMDFRNSEARQYLEKFHFLDLEGVKLPFWVKNPVERFRMLQISAVLKRVQTEKNGFYTTDVPNHDGENKKFIDTIIQLIEGEKLRIGNLIGEDERFAATYDTKTNQLNIGKEIDLNNLKDQSTIVHELFHFYQDFQRKEQSVTDTESQAYLKQAEMLLQVYEKVKEKGEFKNSEDFFEKTFFFKKGKDDSETLELIPQYVAFQSIYFQREGDGDRHQEYLNKLKIAINISYFLLDIYKEISDSTIKQVRQLVAFLEKDQTQEKFLKNLSQKVISQKAMKDKELRELNDLLKKAPSSPQDDFVTQMRIKFTNVIRSCTASMFLTDIYQTKKQRHTSNEFSFKNVTEMLKGLAELDPLSHYAIVDDGV